MEIAGTIRAHRKWQHRHEKELKTEYSENLSQSANDFWYKNTGGPRYARVCYSRLVNCVQNSLSADISLRFCPFSMATWTVRCQNSGPLLFTVLVFAEYSENVTPANNEGRL